MPPPHTVKEELVVACAKYYHLSVLIETGTFYGDMVYSQLKNFEKIISIELSPFFFNQATRTFRKSKNVILFSGDSGEVLNKLLKEGFLKNPCLMWLDGHYCGGKSAFSQKGTPILSELEAILKSKARHIILIDDARYFKGQKGYPSIEEIHKFVMDHNSEYRVTIQSDIIKIDYEM